MEKEIISKFKEKPKTKIAWLAMWLGLATLLMPPFLGIFGAVILPIIEKAGDGNIGGIIGFCFAIFALAFSISAFVIGFCAYKKGERSWVLWLGFIPAILIGTFWVFMIAGEFLFSH